MPTLHSFASVTRCPKCGKTIIASDADKYNGSAHYYLYTQKYCTIQDCLKDRIEHIHKDCICGYSWIERTYSDPVTAQEIKEFLEEYKERMKGAK